MVTPLNPPAFCAPPTARVRGFHRSGFTLIELLVVMLIIGVLMTIGMLVAHRVTGSGKMRMTESILRVLDTTVTSSMADRDARIPKSYIDGTGKEFPILDGRNLSPVLSTTMPFDPVLDPAEPTVALLLLAMSDSANIDQTVKGIEPKLVTRGVVNTSLGIPQLAQADPQGSLNVQSLTIVDAWGKPIRFVHPAYQGGYGNYFLQAAATWTAGPARPNLQLKLKQATGNNNTVTVDYRRSYRPFDPTTAPSTSIGDADEGLCQGNRPYFYSVGADGDPGTREDNVYSTRPVFPPETAKQN